MGSKAWRPDRTGKFKVRDYESYESYTKSQGGKLERQRAKWAAKGGAWKEALSKRLENLPFEIEGKNVLCLGARLGWEVEAFIEKGAFAVGVDLNPGPDNKYVLVGDFHDLQYADCSVDIVFTNSLDHCLDIDKVLFEIKRVLNWHGIFMLEAKIGTDERGGSDPYDCFEYRSRQQLFDYVISRGFDALHYYDFRQPKAQSGVLLRLKGTPLDGLVGCWLENENGGNTIFDLSGKGQ